jgi:hypothetical protein
MLRINKALPRDQRSRLKYPVVRQPAALCGCLRGASDGYSERVGRSAANKTWYLGSSRTDFVNRGSCISLLMRATLASAVLLGCLLFFLIQPC